MATDNTEVDEVEIDLESMSDDELTAFGEALAETYTELRSAEEFSEEDIDEIASVKDALLAVKEEVEAREAFAAEQEEVDEALFAVKNFGKKKAVAFEAAEEEDADEVVEDDKEEAAAKVVISPKGLAGDTVADKVETEPVAASAKPFNVTIGADVRGFKAGQAVESWSDVARAFMAKQPDLRTADQQSTGGRHLVASIAAEYPEARILNNDLDLTMARIKAVTSDEAITASGGFCAPLQPYYALQVWGDTCRPVRDLFPTFKADRGGIRYVTSPKLSRLAGSTRKTTAAQDAAGYTNQTPAGTTAPKPCLHVVCEGEQTCVINAFSRCLTFGNLGSRTYPEQVEAWLKLAGVEFARYNEIELLDQLSAGSLDMTAAQILGATFSLLDQAALITASFRSRYRLCSTANLRAVFPWWVREILRRDIAAQNPGDGLARYNVSDAQIDSWFASRNINVSFYQDYTTADGAPFVDPVAGPIETWPTSVRWFVWPEGHWVYLDGGTLDLGLVRDSTLNSQNDYQIWMEEFSGLCPVGGGESLQITTTICGNGVTAAPAGSAC